MKRIYKYATGDKVPEGAIYLNTIVQRKVYDDEEREWFDCHYVWHYFLVEVKR